MRPLRWLFALAVLGLIGGSASAENKRLLLVTDSGGFIHDSVGLSEQILKEIGPKNGIDVTCYRYTRDPKDAAFAKYAEAFRKTTGVAVEEENCGRVNAETLKKFDCVLFFTTGNPLTSDEVKDLSDWVKAGGSVTGTLRFGHAVSGQGSPGQRLYGDLIGAISMDIRGTKDQDHRARIRSTRPGMRLQDRRRDHRRDLPVSPGAI